LAERKTAHEKCCWRGHLTTQNVRPTGPWSVSQWPAANLLMETLYYTNVVKFAGIVLVVVVIIITFFNKSWGAYVKIRKGCYLYASVFGISGCPLPVTGKATVCWRHYGIFSSQSRFRLFSAPPFSSHQTKRYKRHGNVSNFDRINILSLIYKSYKTVAVDVTEWNV